ncbi:MAG: hypothetical protein JSU01_14635 [Bacteroidetes bacterium]|nr:hypothetical protein [Bacteroidota bacterium]
MRGYITVPETYSCLTCKHCGARPVIAMAAEGEYVVKCPNDPSHYQTPPGLIDIDDWNEHNATTAFKRADAAPGILDDHFFHLNGAILPLNHAD